MNGEMLSGILIRMNLPSTPDIPGSLLKTSPEGWPSDLYTQILQADFQLVVRIQNQEPHLPLISQDIIIKI